jgi:hypothetical protein
MVIERLYFEARSVIDGLVLKHVFRTILAHPWAELDHVKRQFPHHNLFFPQETVTLTAIRNGNEHSFPTDESA